MRTTPLKVALKIHEIAGAHESAKPRLVFTPTSQVIYDLHIPLSKSQVTSALDLLILKCKEKRWEYEPNPKTFRVGLEDPDAVGLSGLGGAAVSKKLRCGSVLIERLTGLVVPEHYATVILHPENKGVPVPILKAMRRLGIEKGAAKAVTRPKLISKILTGKNATVIAELIEKHGVSAGAY